MTDLALLASGRDADVFALDARRVLRRYRDGGDVAAEATLMAYLAGCGFPVPIVHAARGTDLVMERLEGPTMLSALVAGDLRIAQAAELLADLHRRLHEVPPRVTRDPSTRMLHLDLHPDNVMLSARGPVVIDWRNAREGPPDLDLAMSAVILAQVAVDPAHPMAAPAASLLSEFLNRTGGDPLSAVDAAVALRRANPTLTPDEVDRLPAALAIVRDRPARGPGMPGAPCR